MFQDACCAVVWDSSFKLFHLSLHCLAEEELQLTRSLDCFLTNNSKEQVGTERESTSPLTSTEPLHLEVVFSFFFSARAPLNFSSNKEREPAGVALIFTRRCISDRRAIETNANPRLLPAAAPAAPSGHNTSIATRTFFRDYGVGFVGGRGTPGTFTHTHTHQLTASTLEGVCLTVIYALSVT